MLGASFDLHLHMAIRIRGRRAGGLFFYQPGMIGPGLLNTQMKCKKSSSLLHGSAS
uniref:Uncharacterized protein n=1 Tax=Utricularia reniformis TaxID=192314 RepID=A0A1Y0B0M5_9LAMI|nr:hypothetical protein AEK19_MT0679 [Utricularia reniformis]ART30928.1 hypothetical protein AEK19_MT0679 [Utricularia reniformis]